MHIAGSPSPKKNHPLNSQSWHQHSTRIIHSLLIMLLWLAAVAFRPHCFPLSFLTAAKRLCSARHRQAAGGVMVRGRLAGCTGLLLHSCQHLNLAVHCWVSPCRRDRSGGRAQVCRSGRAVLRRAGQPAAARDKCPVLPAAAADACRQQPTLTSPAASAGWAAQATGAAATWARSASSAASSRSVTMSAIVSSGALGGGWPGRRGRGVGRVQCQAQPAGKESGAARRQGAVCAPRRQAEALLG